MTGCRMRDPPCRPDPPPFFREYGLFIRDFWQVAATGWTAKSRSDATQRDEGLWYQELSAAVREANACGRKPEMIDVQALSKRYPTRLAVDDVTFSVKQGEIVGFLGPNGAGKTTTMRVLTGFLPPTSGSARVAGHDVATQSMEARAAIGYLPESAATYPEMRVSEYLAFRARLEGVPEGRVRACVDEAIERCLLREVARRRIDNLSKGYRQRTALAGALVHQPPVLILDEPTIGLDPVQIIRIRETIRELGRDRAVLLSTHILPEVEAVCDRVLIIDRGRIVAEGTPTELRGKLAGTPPVHVTIRGSVAGAREAFAAVPGVTAVDVAEE